MRKQSYYNDFLQSAGSLLTERTDPADSILGDPPLQCRDTQNSIPTLQCKITSEPPVHADPFYNVEPLDESADGDFYRRMKMVTGQIKECPACQGDMHFEKAVGRDVDWYVCRGCGERHKPETMESITLADLGPHLRPMDDEAGQWWDSLGDGRYQVAQLFGGTLSVVMSRADMDYSNMDPAFREHLEEYYYEVIRPQLSESMWDRFEKQTLTECEDGSKMWQEIAFKLPPELIYHAAIRLGAHATTGPYSDTVVPELEFMEALKRWEDYAGQYGYAEVAEEYNKLLRLCESAGIEVSDRYTALGIGHPDPETVCQGQCEGTGYVPIDGCDFDPPLCGGCEGKCRSTVKEDEVWREPWLQAEVENPNKPGDSYHFVKCPDCGGTGKLPGLGSVWESSNVISQRMVTVDELRQMAFDETRTRSVGFIRMSAKDNSVYVTDERGNEVRFDLSVPSQEDEAEKYSNQLMLKRVAKQRFKVGDSVVVTGMVGQPTGKIVRIDRSGMVRVEIQGETITINPWKLEHTTRESVIEQEEQKQVVTIKLNQSNVSMLTRWLQTVEAQFGIEVHSVEQGTGTTEAVVTLTASTPTSVDQLGNRLMTLRLGSITSTQTEAINEATDIERAVNKIRSMLPELRRLTDEQRSLSRESSDATQAASAHANEVLRAAGVERYADLTSEQQADIDNSPYRQRERELTAKKDEVRKQINTLDDEIATILMDIPASRVTRFSPSFIRMFGYGLTSINWKEVDDYLNTLHLQGEAADVRSELNNLRAVPITDIEVGDRIWESKNLWEVLRIIGKRMDIEMQTIVGDRKKVKFPGIRKGRTNTYVVVPRKLVQDMLDLNQKYMRALGRSVIESAEVTPLVAFIAYHTSLTTEGCEPFIEFVHTSGFGEHEDMGRYFLLYDEWPGRAQAGPVLVPYLGEIVGRTFKLHTGRDDWSEGDSVSAAEDLELLVNDGLSQSIGREVYVEVDSHMVEDQYTRQFDETFTISFEAGLHDDTTGERIGSCHVEADYEIVDENDKRYAAITQLEVKVISLIEAMTERGKQYKDAPYPDAETGFPPEGASRDSREWYEWAVNYAYHILTRNVFPENEIDYWTGQGRRTPENMPREVWQEAYKTMKKRGLDVTVKTGTSAQPFVSRQESTMEGKKFVSITLDENSDLNAVRGQVHAAITEGSKVLLKVGHESMKRVVEEYRHQDGVQVSDAVQERGITGPEVVVTNDPHGEALKYMASLDAQGIIYTTTEHGNGAITVVPKRDAAHITYQREAVEEAKVNPATFQGSWDDILDNIIRTYGQYNYFIFTNPDTGRENTVLPLKQGIDWWQRATQRDIKRIMVESIVTEAAKGELLWMRVGDMGNYHHHDQDIQGAADHLIEVGFGAQVLRGVWTGQELIEGIGWRKGGIEIGLYDGNNYVSLYWGDEDSDMDRDLDRKEQTTFVKALRKALKEYE